MMNHTVLDAKEASQIVFRGKVGPSKLLKMGKRKEIPMIKVGGRYFFSLEDLQKYIAGSFGPLGALPEPATSSDGALGA